MNFKEIKDNRAYQIIAAVIAGYVFFALAFYFIGIKPKIVKVQELKAQISEKQIFLSKAGPIQLQQEKISEAALRIQELKRDIIYYERKLPTEKDIPDLLQNLSATATETGVKLLEIEKKQEIREERGQTFYITVPFNLVFKGGYHNIGSFVNKLENAERFMKIQHLTIKGDAKDPFEHRAEAVVLTYILDARGLTGEK